MTSRIGYARISTTAQDLSLQIDALEAAGCDRIYTDTMSGSRTDRPELARCLDHLRTGDTLVVWKLDRLGRSVSHLLKMVEEELEPRGVNFASLTEGFDTGTPGGKMVFTVLGAMAELERNTIRERTRAGLAAARARGSVGGRPKAMTDKKLALARQRLDNGETAKAVAESIGVSRATLYRHLERATAS